MNNYYYLGSKDFDLPDGRKMLKISILSLASKTIHNIYKAYTKELVSKLDNKYKLFDNCTNDITFVIKRNGSIALDIR